MMGKKVLSLSLVTIFFILDQLNLMSNNVFVGTIVMQLHIQIGCYQRVMDSFSKN